MRDSKIWIENSMETLPFDLPLQLQDGEWFSVLTTLEVNNSDFHGKRYSLEV